MAHSNSLYLAHHDMNQFITSARGSPQSTVFYNRPVLIGPAFINSQVFASLQAHAIARWFLRSAAIRGESDDPNII